MPALGQSKAWEQQGEAEAPAPCPDRLQPAGKTSSDRNTPRAGLTFGESIGVEQGRETLLDWEHQALSPGLTHSARRYGIRQVQQERWLLSTACVTGDWWGKTSPSRAPLRGLASGCPPVP